MDSELVKDEKKKQQQKPTVCSSAVIVLYWRTFKTKPVLLFSKIFLFSSFSLAKSFLRSVLYSKTTGRWSSYRGLSNIPNTLLQIMTKCSFCLTNIARTNWNKTLTRSGFSFRHIHFSLNGVTTCSDNYSGL